MIKLYQPPAAWGLPSLSPFGVKLELYLRMAGIPFQVRVANPLKSPKKKMPYVRFESGEVMGDSQFILERLERERGESLDAHLDEAERAVGQAVRRMLEEGTYWVVMFLRWSEDDGWERQRPVFTRMLPAPFFLRPLIATLVRRNVRSALHAQGTGRHTRQEVEGQGVQDLQAVAGVLGDRPFLLGERPTTFDCSVYAFVSAALAFPARSALKDYVEGEPRLTAYVERVRSRFWPE